MQTLLVSSKDLGVLLRNVRKQQGITQAEHGKRVGLDPKRISLLENGNPNCRLGSLVRLLSALGFALTIKSKIDQTDQGPDVW